jgi:hypothetical protein
MLPAEQVTQKISVNENGRISEKEVCQRCYNNMITETNNSANLLTE